MSQNIPLHQYLDVETLFQEKNLEDIVNIEKLLEVEIERKRRDLRSMVGDRYRDILGASDAIKSMEIISQNIVENIDNISFTSQALVNNPLVFNQDQSEAIKFPKEDPKLKMWLQAIGLDPAVWQWARHKLICSKHFKNEDFFVINGKKHIKPTAMPSLLYGNDDQGLVTMCDTSTVDLSSTQNYQETSGSIIDASCSTQKDAKTSISANKKDSPSSAESLIK